VAGSMRRPKPLTAEDAEDAEGNKSKD